MSGTRSRLRILKTGETFETLKRAHGDFEAWITRGLAVSPDDVTVIDARRDPLPGTDERTPVVVTGSPEMVTDQAPWMVAAEDWLRGLVARDVPVLGICFGHQMLAHALGGTLGEEAEHREYGTVTVTVTERGAGDPLLAGIPPSFPAHASHRESVSRLPDGAALLATSDADPHHAFRFGRCAWGVQFHPEFTEDIMRSYVERHRASLAGLGRDPDAALAGVVPSPAASILAAFARRFGDSR
ncbi:glutamine amidotransferase [bacterium]|nr:glutamine amidotransferase [bacterium]